MYNVHSSPRSGYRPQLYITRLSPLLSLHNSPTMNQFMRPPPSFFAQSPPHAQMYATPSGVLTWTPNQMSCQPLPHQFMHIVQSAFPPTAQHSPAQFASTPQLSPIAVSTPAPWIPHLSGSIKAAPWLIPNPYNPQSPHTFWDVCQVPSTAKRLTGKHVIVDLKPHFDDEATSPGAPKVHIVCDVDIINRLWGPIIIKSDGVVKVWDILQGIYQHLQTPLTRREVDLMTEADAKNYDKIVDAMYRRCSRDPSLPGRAWKDGLKRVDCLGDMTAFGGLRIVENPDNTWQFHLVLLNRPAL